MLKINKNKILSLVLLGVSILAISDIINFSNKLFFILIVILSIIISNFKFRFKSFLLSIYALLLIYIQFLFNQYIVSEEFFISCFGILLIVKFAELDDKNNLLSYNLICMVISVTSLINGQDIISSSLSLLIIILLIINMYLVQQKEVMDFNFRNVIKYLGFGFSIFPIIIIFYLIFPRAEINLRLFNPAKGSLGIPDTINLGSFEQFSNSNEKVFTLVNNNYKKEDLYFRVKIFDYMEDDKSWRPSSPFYLYKTYKNALKLSNSEDLGETYQIILEPYKRKWIPSLSNSEILNTGSKITKDPYNQVFISKDPIDREKQLNFKKYKTEYLLSDELKSYYTKLPTTISDNLVEWVKNNKQNKDDIEYLNSILKKFGDGTFYYNLSPQNISSNGYADFFFNFKEGYCEYFAGTFVLLSRLANIPSRLVSGYYGGELNTVGNFYDFRQKDTHAWAEVWIEDQGWLRVDPTSVIPPQNVKSTLNDMFGANEQANDSIMNFKFLKKVSYYLNYVDFIWTRHLLSYDNNERKSFINDLLNFKFAKFVYWIFAPLAVFIIILLSLKFNKANLISLFFKLIIWKSTKDKIIYKSDTPREILNKLNYEYQKKYRSFFDMYESFRYSNQNINLTKILRTIISTK